jgi:phosphoglucosamine mutase
MNLFGTDGIRGIANHDLTCKVAFKLGRAIGSYLSPGKNICVGKDTRISGDMLEASFCCRDHVYRQRRNMPWVVTTPGLSFLVRCLELGGGVMISASHNPFEYNGLKVFGPDGKKIPDEIELSISKMISDETGDECFPTGKGIGRMIDGKQYVRRYVEFLRRLPEGDLSGLRILVDTANGSASHLASDVWKNPDPPLIS